MNLILLLVLSTAFLTLSPLVLAWCARHKANSAVSAVVRFRGTVGIHLVLFAALYLTLFGWAVGLVRAQPPAAPTTPSEERVRAGGMTTGDGLAILGAALATGLSVLGASYAVAVVGSASLGALTEKPEMFGRTLVFIGLAEGLAIYGLIVSILILERLR
jgi:V/A-type H+-transporting ATPase subunit K